MIRFAFILSLAFVSCARPSENDSMGDIDHGAHTVNDDPSYSEPPLSVARILFPVSQEGARSQGRDAVIATDEVEMSMRATILGEDSEEGRFASAVIMELKISSNIDLSLFHERVHVILENQKILSPESIDIDLMSLPVDTVQFLAAHLNYHFTFLYNLVDQNVALDIEQVEFHLPEIETRYQVKLLSSRSIRFRIDD